MYPVRTVWVLDSNEVFALAHPRSRDEHNELSLRHLPAAGELLDLRVLPVLRAYTLAGPSQPPRLASRSHTSAATAQRRLRRLRLTGGAEIATLVDRCQVGLDVQEFLFIQNDDGRWPARRALTLPGRPGPG